MKLALSAPPVPDGYALKPPGPGLCCVSSARETAILGRQGPYHVSQISEAAFPRPSASDKLQDSSLSGRTEPA